MIELSHAIMRGADRARLNRALDAEEDDIPEGAYCLIREAREAGDSPARLVESLISFQIAGTVVHPRAAPVVTDPMVG